jgi:dienelactone hydrolase
LVWRTNWFLAQQFPADQTPGVFENSSGPTWKGANLELAHEMLPVISAIAKQPPVNPEKIILAGQSRGATLALIMGSTTNGINAVLANVPTFPPTQLNNPMLVLRGEVWEVVPKQIIGNLKIPVFVIGATKDEVVPPSSTQDFFDSVKIMKNSNIQTTWIQGKHNLGYPTLNPESSKKVRQVMMEFLLNKL